MRNSELFKLDHKEESGPRAWKCQQEEGYAKFVEQWSFVGFELGSGCSNLPNCL